MAETVELGPLAVTLLTERRTSCLLCAGRCDPTRWLCQGCHRRLMAEAAQGAIEEALKDAKLLSKEIPQDDRGEPSGCA